jgi:hypothetical protein
MAEAMLGDIVYGSGLKPMEEYVGHYCDVADSPADAARIAGEI